MSNSEIRLSSLLHLFLPFSGSGKRGRVPGGGQQRHLAAVRGDHRAVARLQGHLRRQSGREEGRGAAPGENPSHPEGELRSNSVSPPRNILPIT